MKDQFTKFLYWTLGVFIVGVLGYVSMVTIFACGTSRNCAQAQATVDRTPIPVPPPAFVPTKVFTSNASQSTAPTGPEACRVVASDLADAWAAAGYPETGEFPFTDADGQSCQATANEVKSIMVMSTSMDVIVSAGMPVP